MTPTLQDLATQALKLPPAQRAQLAETLIASLEEFDTAENERLWVEEAERRYREYKAGNTPAYSMDEFFREIAERMN